MKTNDQTPATGNKAPAKMGNTVRETSAKIGVTRQVTLKHIASGALPAINVGLSDERPTWLILDNHIEAFFKNRQTAASQEAGHDA